MIELWLRGSQGNGQDKFGSTTITAGQINVSPVSPKDIAGDGQPHAGSGDLSPHVLTTIEFVENTRLFGFRQRFPFVVHGDREVFPEQFRRYVDGRLSGGVFQRVIDELPHGKLDQVRVYMDPRQSL